MGGVISGGKGPVILFLLQDREAGKVKVNINFIKIIIGLDKVKEEVRAFREAVRVLTRNL